MDTRCVFLALDNQPKQSEALDALRRIMDGPMEPYMFGVKANDLLHTNPGGPEFVDKVLNHWPELNVFLDLKCGDVSATDVNILRHYCGLAENRLWATVSLASSANCFAMLRKEFPALKVIGMGVPTDMKEEECIEKHGGTPVEVIERWMSSVTERFMKITESEDPAVAALITSNDTLGWALKNYDIPCILPGVRDRWMAKDHQERITTVVDALQNGADYLVMGAQLLVGNRKAEVPISGEQSQQRTADVLAAYFASLD